MKIVNQGVASLDKIDRDAGTKKYSFTKKLFLEYMEGDSGWIWSAKRRMKLDGWLGCISVLVNLNCRENDKV